MPRTLERLILLNLSPQLQDIRSYYPGEIEDISCAPRSQNPYVPLAALFCKTFINYLSNSCSLMLAGLGIMLALHYNSDGSKTDVCKIEDRAVIPIP